MDKHKNPWRGQGWGDFLLEVAPYIRGVLKNGDPDWRKLARWLKTECRAAKVKVPPLVKLPARPRVRKKTALGMLAEAVSAA